MDMKEIERRLENLKEEITAEAWPKIARPAFYKGIGLGILFGIWIAGAALYCFINYYI